MLGAKAMLCTDVQAKLKMLRCGLPEVFTSNMNVVPLCEWAMELVHDLARKGYCVGHFVGNYLNVNVLLYVCKCLIVFNNVFQT